MNAYRHPASFRPPLALGGHCWLAVRLFSGHDDFYLTCVGCYVTIPAWALHEGFWRNFAGQWCLGAVRTLPAPGPEWCPEWGSHCACWTFGSGCCHGCGTAP